MNYFSERERGAPARESEEIPHNAWRGILAKIQTCINNGSFGENYPAIGPDGTYVCGTDEYSFEGAMLAEIPGLAKQGSIPNIIYHPNDQPSTLDILDLIEFCWQNVGQPRITGYHGFRSHSHLVFDKDRTIKRENFRNSIETIFRRNGIAYLLNEDGHIERIVPTEFQGISVKSDFDTGDEELNRLLTVAQRKFLDLCHDTRSEALDALWDAWERLKTFGDGANKKVQIKKLLDATAGNDFPKFREALEWEAKELTRIGNQLGIRHSETDQERLSNGKHIDYLYYRLFSLIWLILQHNSQSKSNANEDISLNDLPW